jgi:hypothetical protein
LAVIRPEHEELEISSPAALDKSKIPSDDKGVHGDNL